MAINCCSIEFHESLKADPATFRANTAFYCFYEDDVERLEMRNCLVPGCNSTLCIVVPKLDAPQQDNLQES